MALISSSLSLVYSLPGFKKKKSLKYRLLIRSIKSPLGCDLNHSAPKFLFQRSDICVDFFKNYLCVCKILF